MPSSFTWLDHSDAERRKVLDAIDRFKESDARPVFSSWRLVPRPIAGMLSYEVERRMVAGDGAAENTPEARKKRRGLLRFSVTDGRLAGMPVLALLYPSLYLPKACDPAKLLVEQAREARAEDAEQQSVDTTRLAHVLATARERIEVGLNWLGAPPTEGAVDEPWYWAAPLLLDRALDANATMAWFDQADLATAWAGASGPSKPEVHAADDSEDGGATTEATRAAADDDDGDAWEKHVQAPAALASVRRW